MVKNILRLPFWQIKSGFVSPSAAENSEPKRQKLSNESTTEPAIDMISDLPELVLFHILSFLPTNDAVATSILSTKWRFLWTKMTIFNFDDGLFPAGGSGPSGRRNRRLDAGKREIFVNFVDRVFLVTAATFMKKLSLKCGKRCGQNHINNWIRTAIGRGVEELDLTTYGHGLDYRLPGSSLFICKTLVALNLSGDVMINETSSGSFPNLKILYLTSVKYQSDDSVRKFISSCLVLEQLTVVRDREDNVVTFTISAPTLKHLTIDFRSCSDDSDRALKINAPALQCLNLFDDLSINFMVEDLTSLVEAKVDVFNKKMLMYNEGYRDSVVGFLMSLHNAKILCLRYHSVEVLSYYWISTRFQNLIRLVLQSRYCDWIALEDLLQQAENLETFHVNARFIHWREPEQVPKCVSSTLTRIFLGSFGCVKYERTMVKYFLNNAKVLKSMEILTYNVDELKKENTLQKILRFQRASQACQIKLS
ncbi:F-box/LRR-repeat protein At3g59190-like [Coffea eugenioides]|uniref:F-box/LRR-repeat protein At3g59190-like n=1 Tax=Coffea eugenioides TaxID=49369 RepID=UPI000F60D0FC|nr:F-box/LRR-repeat protein At3g59190-like [Coffea eugenioides]XP_027171282.1 F-box/LRR-repeat protein At3g59190-like [Coffea eugenioides]XP_027171283.1 F-box/LRR-repeat protein At3g59190-like [Coffea eugenioides]XP_027171284.1 F-box/LRR-repeat protein At3g59190-like [Coffea eugenioides]XP_027171358.1 F-box/LRR-repeat protein At3g59190-like [Coffea eugenioides]XP_027171359.1 F-box/LRR-repeat protein At3g59190-like [Coffea eugenioides]XP_027171360.1 F-box/LRR-repeat protein At3g59190-like [Cof